MTQPLPTAPRPAVLDLELQAVAAAVGGLRKQLQYATQRILALYISFAGSLNNELPTHLRRTFADAAAQVIAAVAFTNRTALQALVRQALVLGAADAAYTGTAAAATAVAQPIRPELEDWVQQIVGTLAERVFATIASAQALPQILRPGDHKTVMVIIGKMSEAGNIAERDTRWAVNAAYNQSFRERADAQRVPVVWVAEFDACLHCLAYSGEVAQPGWPFPLNLTFYRDPAGNPKPLKHPPGRVLWGPPLHPNCRCSLELYLGSTGYPVMPWETEEFTVAQALRREAERTVLRGEAGVDSQPALVRAASALLSRGTALPITHQRRARRAIRAGRFR
jgi:hypothetical protein